MDWLLLTFFSVVCRSIYGVMTKVLSNRLKVSVYTQATLLSFAAGVIAILISPFFGGLHFDISQASLITVGLVMLAQGLGNMTYFQAIKNLTNGTAQITFSSILIFNTILSLLFLNLQLSFINFFGLVLLMLAILSVTTGKVELHKKGVSMMVLSAFLFSVFQLSSASVSKEVGVITYLLFAYFGSALVVFAIKSKVVVRDLHKADKRSVLGIPFLTAIPSLGNFIFAYYAYRSAPQSAKVAILLTSQVVLTVVLSYFFLNEKDNLPRKAGASILVFISAILIKD